jgi:hypothetical protein
MLYREIIAACSEIFTKQINTLCGQNVENLDFETGGTHSNHSSISDRTGHCTCPALGSYIG